MAKDPKDGKQVTKVTTLPTYIHCADEAQARYLASWDDWQAQAYSMPIVVAAEALGIGRTTLAAHMHRAGLRPIQRGHTHYLSITNLATLLRRGLRPHVTTTEREADRLETGVHIGVLPSIK